MTGVFQSCAIAHRVITDDFSYACSALFCSVQTVCKPGDYSVNKSILFTYRVKHDGCFALLELLKSILLVLGFICTVISYPDPEKRTHYLVRFYSEYKLTMFLNFYQD